MKSLEKSPVKKHAIRSILISQPEPSTGRSPYFDLADKYDLKVDFYPFIHVEGLSSKEFLRQKIEISEYSAIIFTSRHSIDHFFRICEEMKIKISPEMKYFCVRKTVALYLQKYIQYRKRKIFFPEDGRTAGLLEMLKKYKSKEKFLIPSSEQSNDDIPQWLKKNKADFKKAILYQTVGNDVREVMKNQYDTIVFFSPIGVKALFDSIPDYRQGDTVVGAFGNTTCEAVKNAGLRLDILAPTSGAPSMTTALENYLKED